MADVAALDDALSGVDAVVHLAALTSVRAAAAAPNECHRRNVTATVRLLQATCFRDVHLVFASSTAVYGNATTPPVLMRWCLDSLQPHCPDNQCACLAMGAKHGRDSWADVACLRRVFPMLPAVDQYDELQRTVQWHRINLAMADTPSR